MITRKSSPHPIDRAVDTGVAPRGLVRADAALGSLAIAAVLVLAAAQVAGCTRPDERAVRPSDDGTSIVDATARPQGAGSTTPVATPSIVPTVEVPRLAGEPAPVSPATATAPASASGSGSAKPPTPPPNPNPDPPPLPGKIAPPHVRPGNDRI